MEAGPLVAVLEDAYPVSPGHSLVVPRRHEASLLELTAEEQALLWRTATVVGARLLKELGADGLNVGINVGAAAGQTVGHVHVHLIPRFAGDVADPRGGIRWVVPEKARYWP